MADGKGCRCAASCEWECGCSDVDWTPQEVYDLRAELATRTAERDEARRIACEYEARYEEEHCFPTSLAVEKNIQRDTKRIADERGWDCFDAEGDKTC
jgi:hypothetical protein